MNFKTSFLNSGSRIKYHSGFIALIVLSLFSCNSARHVTYFKDVPDSIYSKKMSINIDNAPDLTIKPDDILQVSIQSIDPELNNMLGTGNQNIAFESNGAPAANTPATGFLVDKNGFIELPMAGKIHVAGLTTYEVKDSIRALILPFYKKPVVNVRLANFKITVLGEVTHPGTYTIPNEDVNLLDAIGIAGDLTIYAKRENVLLIRKEHGEKQFMRFNLSSSSLFKSPWFNLQQGDVIYVEPDKVKVSSTDLAKTRTYTLLAAGASVLIVLLSRVNF